MLVRSYQIDMCNGPLFPKIVRFTVPLIAANLLQLFFHAADLIVLGQFAPHEAMAAVGATSAISALLVNTFMGLAIGVNVVAANFFGAGDKRNMHRTVHTAMTLALFGGIIIMIAAAFAVKPLLVLTGTPDSVMDKASIYLWICLLGIPFQMICNNGCSILRAVGDTRHPLYYLTFAGIVNVLLNLLFVVGFHCDVAGVAIATAASQGLSAWLILRLMTKARDGCHLNLHCLMIDWGLFRRMLKIGIPAGVQSACFAISNMTIQSSINSFGSLAIAGSAAAVQIEAFVYISSYSFHQAAISVVAQNLGGKMYRRIRQSIYVCLACAVSLSFLLGICSLIFSTPLLEIFNPNPDVIKWGAIRVKILLPTYFICGIMDTMSGSLRGLGYSLTAAVSSLLGVCVFRIWWVFAIFPAFHTFENLMISYPISWLLVSSFNAVCVYRIMKELFRSRQKISIV